MNATTHWKTKNNYIQYQTFYWTSANPDWRKTLKALATITQIYLD